MREIKLSMNMLVEDDFVTEAETWTHHIEYLIDLDSYPEIKSVYNVNVDTVGA